MNHELPATRVRRTYNQWVANETLEDFALRFTARRARRWSSARVANTALGSISFLALEAIGGALTLTYGFDNAIVAICLVGAVLFLTGLPIAYHAAKASVDIDLLTRGAGFGYMGSTVTSLIYATFTFLFFALEATILSKALELCFGVPLGVAYLLNALVVIPLVTHGFTRIGVFQTWTQPFWLFLQLAPFVLVFWQGAQLQDWLSHGGRVGDAAGGVDILLVAAATGVALSLIAQIGEQVDFLRFLPEPRTPAQRRRWWAALLLAGPGWAVLGTLKMLAGSFLAVLVLGAGVPPGAAVEPTYMYLTVFERFVPVELALILTGVFVILAQLKINVTNAYAGSIAWSNFFSRLTHSHPGRVAWLVFNVVIALMLMQFGVFGALEKALGLYAHVAVAWIGALTADLVVNQPLGLRPRGVEFRRAFLYDVNPVGVGAMVLATCVSLAAYLDLFGPAAAAFSTLMALAIAFTAAIAIAWITGGRYYLARTPAGPNTPGLRACTICEHEFDPEDMAHCPFHQGTICSLCCSLESRCGDVCKPHAAWDSQLASVAHRLLPTGAVELVFSRFARFFGIAGVFTLVIGLTLLLIHQQAVSVAPESAEVLGRTLLIAFGLLVIIVGVAAWLQTLAHESGRVAAEERERQTGRLLAEIRAHQRTDAELQRAKETAEAANEAKSRYVAGISHELRTPLNAILGYAQLLESDPSLPEHRHGAVAVIRRSSEHLADLIEGLLDISKIEAGRLEVCRDSTNFRELLEQMATIFRREAEAKGLGFVADIGDDLPQQVHADERRLRQILMNLLSNAVRFTDRGEVRFRVRFRNEVATFTVEDTGRGIPAGDRERIFQPFERLEDPRRPVPGTGLGLTITRLLVELLGGELRLDSEVGSGSRFRVRLMLPRIAGARPVTAQRRVYGYRGRRRHVLIVDDNPEHRALLADALKPLGFTVSLAESGTAALAAVAAASPDAVLIDVAMPGMSGWSLAAKLRTERGLTAPVIMISAHGSEAAAAPDGVAYHDDFVPKPVNLDLLQSRLERHLKLEWLSEEPRAPAAARPAAPVAALDALDELIAIGHVREIERKLAAIEGAEPAAGAFVAAAKRHLETVDLAGLRALIAEARLD